jgi:hypothetical protein
MMAIRRAMVMASSDRVTITPGYADTLNDLDKLGTSASATSCQRTHGFCVSSSNLGLLAGAGQGNADAGHRKAGAACACRRELICTSLSISSTRAA